MQIIDIIEADSIAEYSSIAAWCCPKSLNVYLRYLLESNNICAFFELVVGVRLRQQWSHDHHLFKECWWCFVWILCVLIMYGLDGVFTKRLRTCKNLRRDMEKKHYKLIVLAT